jgi:monoamine oxidase
MITRRVCDAVIVGGGFAGAVAARELGQLGHGVVLVEARGRLGGRTWRKLDALAGLDLEMGGTWIDPRQGQAWAEAQRYAAQVGRPVMGAPPRLWLVAGTLRRGWLPGGAGGAGEVERVVRALGQAAERIDPGRPLAGQDVADLDIGLDEFLATLAIGEETREVASAYLGSYGSAPGHLVSTLHLARRVAAAGSVAELVLSGASYPLLSGTDGLLQAIVSDSGAEVVLEAPVQRIVQDRRGVSAWWAGTELRARVGVVCVPLNVLKAIDFDPPLGSEKLSASREELACRGTKVWALARGVEEGFSACGRGAGLDLVWDEGAAVDGLRLLVGYGPDADELDVSCRDQVEAAVRAFLPGVEVVACAGHDWRHDPYSQQTWDVFRPGQITRYEEGLRRREGRLTFAGSHTALRWPGFIDGAIESGFRAAREAHALLNGVQG